MNKIIEQKVKLYERLLKHGFETGRACFNEQLHEVMVDVRSSLQEAEDLISKKK